MPRTESIAGVVSFRTSSPISSGSAVGGRATNANGSNVTLLLGLYSLQNEFRTPWGIFATASIIISVLLMLLFLFTQRYF